LIEAGQKGRTINIVESLGAMVNIKPKTALFGTSKIFDPINHSNVISLQQDNSQTQSQVSTVEITF